MAAPPPSLPTGAYITIGLLVGLAALLSWLIASYPSNPSQRPAPNDCESTAQQYSQTKREGDAADRETTAFQNDKATPYDTAPDKTKDDIDPERQIVKYNCQLAIYTKHLAQFTRWLVYATTGLIMIGLLQGYFLRRSVLVANDAIQLSREEFNASHRPRIKVREIAIATDGFAKEPALIKGNIIPASGDPQMW